MLRSQNQSLVTTPDFKLDSPSAFSYQPLPNEDSIRIVELLPDKEGSQLRCLIHTSRISDKENYEALSYVWGPSNFTEEIQCDDQVLPITESLKIALHRFRLRNSSRKLWIDQLCINQDNMEERKQQIGIMREIYSAATMVLVWLGPIDTRTALNAKPLVHQISNLRLSMTGPYPRISVEFPSDLTLATCGLPPRNAVSWNALQKLFESPYFSRLWVVQEVVVSSHACVCWGFVEIEWQALRNAISWLYANMCWFGGPKAIDVLTAEVFLGSPDQQLELLRLLHGQDSTKRQSHGT